MGTMIELTMAAPRWLMGNHVQWVFFDSWRTQPFSGLTPDGMARKII
jgi:hypothetical protein